MYYVARQEPKRDKASPKPKSGDVPDASLEKLVDEFVGFDQELKASATKVDALKKKDLGIVVRACQVLHKAKTRGRGEWIEFCKRVAEKGVTLKGSRKRRYAKMGERADRLLSISSRTKVSRTRSLASQTAIMTG